MASKHGSEPNLILINATQSEEIRVAITAGRYLDNLFIEEIGSHRTGNIFKARVTRVVPSLQAAFVDFGSERHGFLPLKEIAPCYLRSTSSGGSPAPVTEGQEIIVQVVKEERGNKGAALTTFITLAGSYLVLMPNNPEAGGISHRIEGEDRDQMRETMSLLDKPAGMGLIVRTAGLGRAQEELKWDLDILLRLWDAINTAAANRPAPFLIHQESDIVIRALRDYLRKDIHEILIDSPELYERAREHTSRVRPEFTHLVKLYEDKNLPLFTRYRIEDQIETAFLRDVHLPSGGCIVIEETEAMVAIDVNSARDTKGGNIEQTAFNTNREAAIEIARQMRLRDIGGQIAIDFIDMASAENQQKILDTFKEETRNDKARVQFSRISRFGILEVTRERLRPSLTESSQIVCPRCSGQGSIRSVESLGLLLLRLIRQEAVHDNVVAVNVQAPIEVATFLINEKRHMLSEVEAQYPILVRIFPNPHLQTPQYKIERVYENQVGQMGNLPPSFKLVEKAQFEIPPVKGAATTSRYSEPAIKMIEAPPKPIIPSKGSPNILTRLWHLLMSNNGKAPSHEESTLSADTPAEMTQTSSEKRRRHRNRRPRNSQSSEGSSTSHSSANTQNRQQHDSRPERPQNRNERNATPQSRNTKPHQPRQQRATPLPKENKPTTTVVASSEEIRLIPAPSVMSEPILIKSTNVAAAEIIPPKTPEITPSIPVSPSLQKTTPPEVFTHSEESVRDETDVKKPEIVTPTPLVAEPETRNKADVISKAQTDNAQSFEQEALATSQEASGEETDAQQPKRHSRHYRNRYRQRGNHYRRGNRSGAKENKEDSPSHEFDKVDD